MLNDTLAAAWRKLAIFPCKPNLKIPATPNGFKDAKFGQNPYLIKSQGYNVGLACEMSGLVVIDQDVDESKGYNGIETIKGFEKIYGKLPLTLTATTPRGGKHCYYSSEGLINPIGKLGKDVDIKYHGYVLIEPSTINGKAYKFIDGIAENGEFIISTLPQAWLNLLNRQVPEITHTKAEKRELILKNVDFKRIFVNCKFLQHCYNQAEILSEPEWFSMISILAPINGGDEIIHKLSEPYYNYSFDETQKKIEYAREFGCSQTCKYLSDTYPEICSLCTHYKNKGV
jgi:hypothetical protein